MVSGCSELVCWRKLPNSPKRAGQTGHPKGLSFSWTVSRCLRNLLRSENMLGHDGHEYGRTRSCTMRTCLLASLLVLKRDVHLLHENERSWTVRTWLSRSRFWAKSWPHPEHEKVRPTVATAGGETVCGAPELVWRRLRGEISVAWFGVFLGFDGAVVGCVCWTFCGWTC